MLWLESLWLSQEKKCHQARGWKSTRDLEFPLLHPFHLALNKFLRTWPWLQFSGGRPILQDAFERRKVRSTVPPAPFVAAEFIPRRKGSSWTKPGNPFNSSQELKMLFEDIEYLTSWLTFFLKNNLHTSSYQRWLIFLKRWLLVYWKAGWILAAIPTPQQVPSELHNLLPRQHTQKYTPIPRTYYSTFSSSFFRKEVLSMHSLTTVLLNLFTSQAVPLTLIRICQSILPSPCFKLTCILLACVSFIWMWYS